MGKVKWSFSLILAIFLVGILSSAAFASDLYNLTTVQNGSGLEVSFTGNSNDPADVEGTQFDLVLKDGSTSIQTLGPIALNSSNQGTLNIPSGVLTPGKVYTIELYHSSDTAHATLLAEASAVVTVGHNSSLLNQANSPKTTDNGGTITLDKNGNGLENANETGLSPTSKKRSGQKMHGFYQNNTNSCASCHQTHTANNGESLLFKDGTYSTCSACHDGTTGAYNSFSALKSGTSNSIAGTFNVSDDAAHGSLHQADGSLQVSAAPGGNNSTNAAVTGTSVYKATWGQDFNCASCHSAHGGGSSEENNLNTDPLGWGGVPYYPVGATKADGSKATQDDANGKLFKGITVQSSVPTTFSTPYILVKTTASGVTSDKTKTGYLLDRAGVHNGDAIIQTYRWDGTEYIADFSLWLRSIGYVSAPFQNENTVLYDNSGKDITTTGMTVVWKDGFAFGSGVNNVVSADLSIGIDVETNSKDAAALYDKTDANYVVDSGVEMTKYCPACHTDYITDPATGTNGTLTAFHRHTGVTDELTCARCHFAHGTKAQIMKDSSDNNPSVNPETISSDNHSSALRRYVDMDSCYTSGCHNSTDTNNPLYLDWSY
jgi:hypothetical protein